MKRLIRIILALSCWFPSPIAAASLPDSLPPLDKLEAAALQRSGLDPAKVGRWQRNARRAVALPRLQVGYDEKSKIKNTAIIQDSISVTSSGITIGPESNRVDQDLGNDRGFEVKAIWSLDELLFNRDELDISREARDLYVVRGRLQQELHEAYFELKSYLLRLELEPESADDPFKILKAQQLMERLNTLSGGEFYRLVKLTPGPKTYAESRPAFHPEVHDEKEAKAPAKSR